MAETTDESSEEKSFIPVDFSKVRIGVKSLTDAVLKLGDLKKVNPTLANKKAILQAIQSGNL